MRWLQGTWYFPKLKEKRKNYAFLCEIWNFFCLCNSQVYYGENSESTLPIGQGCQGIDSDTSFSSWITIFFRKRQFSVAELQSPPHTSYTVLHHYWDKRNSKKLFYYTSISSSHLLWYIHSFKLQQNIIFTFFYIVYSCFLFCQKIIIN